MIARRTWPRHGFVSAGLYSTWILEGGDLWTKASSTVEHLCAATKNEAIALLRGDLGSLAEKGAVGLVEIPTPRELERRTNTSLADQT
jgi:hypothetical protein